MAESKLYRKAALEKISSPEQLDKALKVTSPLSWISLIGVTLIVVVTVIWSIMGTIPVTVTTSGIIASPDNTNAVYTGNAGAVVSVSASVGEEIYMKDVIAEVRTNNGTTYTIESDQVGTVSRVDVAVGDTVSQGTAILHVAPKAKTEQVVVCYVKMADVKKISRGMSVYVYLNAADSQRYGHMEARVINIDEYATSNAGMNYVLGEDNNLASTFTKSGAVAAVTCELYPSKESESGYFWSNKKGRELQVTNGSLVSAKIITEEIAPITKLFTKLMDIWGD